MRIQKNSKLDNKKVESRIEFPDELATEVEEYKLLNKHENSMASSNDKENRKLHVKKDSANDNSADVTLALAPELESQVDKIIQKNAITQQMSKCTQTDAITQQMSKLTSTNKPTNINITYKDRTKKNCSNSD